MRIRKSFLSMWSILRNQEDRKRYKSINSSQRNFYHEHHYDADTKTKWWRQIKDKVERVDIENDEDKTNKKNTKSEPFSQMEYIIHI